MHHRIIIDDLDPRSSRPYAVVTHDLKLVGRFARLESVLNHLRDAGATTTIIDAGVWSIPVDLIASRPPWDDPPDVSVNRDIPE